MTYGVGGFSLLNAVVGAGAERVPLVVISGAPRTSERAHRHLLHHTTGDMNLQYAVYEKLTAAACVLTSPEQAPAQIDTTIEACLRFKRPVYLEVPLDIVGMPCRAPGPFRIDAALTSDAAGAPRGSRGGGGAPGRAQRPVILAGVECHRLGITEGAPGPDRAQRVPVRDGPAREDGHPRGAPAVHRRVRRRRELGACEGDRPRSGHHPVPRHAHDRHRDRRVPAAARPRGGRSPPTPTRCASNGTSTTASV